MGKRIYPLRRIKFWYCYDIEEICSLYKSMRLHPQTVRGWIKKGLPTIDNRQPMLIYGEDLKTFLGKQNEASKCQTDFGEMFCMKCQEATKPKGRRVQLEQVNGFVRAKAHCRECHTIMNKSYKMEAVPRLRKAFVVVDVLELYDSTTCTGKTHILTQEKTGESESAQGSLF